MVLRTMSSFQFHGLTVLCVIPSRMGSTRIKLKNLEEIEPHVSLVRQAYDIADGFYTCISTDQPSLFTKDFPKALIINRPREISDSTSNVSHAILHALLQAEQFYGLKFDLVVALMPAIAARSRSILESMLGIMATNPALLSGITCAHTHPWIWKAESGTSSASNTWYPNSQKNSQDLPDYYVEHASILINRRSVVEDGCKWSLPLLIYSLPSWATALDIDVQLDLDHAKALYPIMKLLLETWTGKSIIINDLVPFSLDV